MTPVPVPVLSVSIATDIAFSKTANGPGGTAPPGRLALVSFTDTLWVSVRSTSVKVSVPEVGTLEVGKWADLCCLDLSGPGTQPVADPAVQLVFSGGRDIVSDVWVAGRQLLSGGELTRLDWSEVAARSAAWAVRMKRG